MPLSRRDTRILGQLATKPGGCSVLNAWVELFAEYEGSGLVTLSTAYCGPLKQPDTEYFWAKITLEGRALLATPEVLEAAV